MSVFQDKGKPFARPFCPEHGSYAPVVPDEEAPAQVHMDPQPLSIYLEVGGDKPQSEDSESQASEAEDVIAGGNIDETAEEVPHGEKAEEFVEAKVHEGVDEELVQESKVGEEEVEDASKAQQKGTWNDALTNEEAEEKAEEFVEAK